MAQAQTNLSPEAADRPVVTQADIAAALRAVGIKAGHILLIHSSLKKFGYVAGGPETVIQAAQEVVTSEGTVVFPTLVQRDFAHAYENWDPVNSPSDVGLITETFRKRPDVLRSNQATHSVAAWGHLAHELTHEHTAYGPRMGPFGDYAFSWSSPWQKMYLYGAHICFMGVETRYNTFKHFVEHCLVEKLLQQIDDHQKRCHAMAMIRRHNVPGLWPYLDSEKTDALLKQHDLIRYATCGQSVFTSFTADDFFRVVFPRIDQHPEEWFEQAFAYWCRQAVSPD